ncbi:hypothetical protein CC85DRAFT_250104 [Cutaneotrichosporon oleaginosum]|uniref:Metal homeostatis protein bsd2 n=1 Tax=Cutaneotrichosporon oleaginosum TaxID=879819 RepID=A0A0J0XG73_9TREE|nr:uncharacterized protein CC85DRAFT_250104 [Cutaneotrichosporon oleaginosum]KLT40062.1 hypothetical protein CC85DRAFT_250104 [Cutaneotrichosporon oleaginosum]TXT10397.1 hypothetical protein COLE_04331 [Cutaneotrichosporon oleaginosum]
MAPYTPIPSGPTGSNVSSPRRPLSFRLQSRRQSLMPDPDEMDRAFDGPGDDEDDTHESHALLGNNPPAAAAPQGRSGTPPMPGDYDFNRDYFLPPSDSPPPFEPYSAHNPAPGNSNGIMPSEPVARPQQARHFLGGVLPSAFLPRKEAPHAVGGGQSGVFANLSARPDGQPIERREDGVEFANEDELKDAPPSYQSALRDAVPPYWDTTVVLPSSSSPFGPLHSSINGDEILIDGMPSGNFFGFIWNLIVSVSFQWVGFLLTYVLHTTHAAKHGSRAGLGITLVRFGLYLRQTGIEYQETGHYPGDFDIDPVTGDYKNDVSAEEQLKMYGSQSWPIPIADIFNPGSNATIILHNLDEAKDYAHKYNHSLLDLMRPPAQDVGRSYVWFSFLLMVCGWFLVLASVGGWWRVKRFERKLHQAQRESEAAQAAARGEVLEGDDDDDSPARPGPHQLSYYTAVFTQALNGAREMQQGFFGARGRRLNRGDTLFGQDESERDLLEAQGYGLEPMARTRSSDDDTGRRAGLWGNMR